MSDHTAIVKQDSECGIGRTEKVSGVTARRPSAKLFRNARHLAEGCSEPTADEKN